MMGIDDFATTVNLKEALSSSDDPSPRCPFPSYDKETLDAFLARSDDAGLLSMEAVLRGPLGLRMFSRWAAQVAPGAGALRAASTFLVDVALLKATRGSKEPLHASIMRSYFEEGIREECQLPCDLRRAPRPKVADEALYALHVKDDGLLGVEAWVTRQSKVSMRRETSFSGAQRYVHCHF